MSSLRSKHHVMTNKIRNLRQDQNNSYREKCRDKILDSRNFFRRHKLLGIKFYFIQIHNFMTILDYLELVSFIRWTWILK